MGSIKGRKPKISVCMAVYNGSKYLKEQLNSILEELHPADELIIVDDHSTDNSVRIIKDLKDKRIKIFLNERNLGPTRTFERGLELATGDFIFFSDQDDVWIKGKIGKMLDAFKKHGTMAVNSDSIVVDEKKKIIAKSFFSLRDSGPGVLKNYYKNTYSGACLAIDCRAKEWILPFPKYIAQHDEWIGLTCDFVGGVHFLREPLIYYRRHPSTQTKLHSLKFGRIILNRLRYSIAILGGLFKLLRMRWKYRRRKKRVDAQGP